MAEAGDCGQGLEVGPGGGGNGTFSDPYNVEAGLTKPLNPDFGVVSFICDENGQLLSVMCLQRWLSNHRLCWIDDGWRGAGHVLFRSVDYRNGGWRFNGSAVQHPDGVAVSCARTLMSQEFDAICSDKF